MERPAESERAPSRADAITAPAAGAPARGERAVPADLAARVRAEAARLGFDAVGFARAEEHPHASRLERWLADGRHGTMAWMGRDPERRSDPRRALAEARTVISVARSYYRGDWPADSGDGPRGLIARYAWGADYHKRLRNHLRELARALAALVPGARWLAYVDTGPVLDRGWAERAGVGWIGKNTNVIRKDAGSWCFLGEILTDVEFPSGAPARNRCGTCARCIAACPTGAIVGPYQLDARRCISYLTIEHAGAIPIELRPAIGARIFGCDDCQEVCPWNRFATKAEDPVGERPDQRAPLLIQLLSLDDGAFRARFHGSALLRAGRDRFVRNVAVALGNAGDPRAVPALRRALHRDRDPHVRGHAAWALGRIGGAEARAALEEATAREQAPEVRHEVHTALASIRGARSSHRPRTRRNTE